MWAVGVGFLLALFYLIDTVNYRRAPREVRERLAEGAEHWQFDGLWNIAWLAVILGAVFLNHPPFAREFLMAGAAVGSWFTTRKEVHEANRFDFHPIQEVAILFVGIFATMMPALDWLASNAQSLLGTVDLPMIAPWLVSATCVISVACVVSSVAGR